jgi:sugar-specific transcriptional regulator TrmB
MAQTIISDYQVLAQIGLSQKAIKCYEALFNNGGCNAPQLAKELNQPRTSLYRILKQLEAKGFVTSLKTEAQPIYFFAQPLDKAMRKYASYQEQLMRELINQQNEILIKRSGKTS